ncbi:MAG TPA: hypothetical protein VEF34_15840 [Syntrophobacteraceae bacterium]|nr:hypothetical protein [Syntrophobacteraceae bacterium]
MSENLNSNLDLWKSELEKAWIEIPKPFRSERAVHTTLQCRLYWIIRELGLRTVADYMPPRIMDRPVDIIAANDQNEIIYAVCVDTLVTLAAVKSLNSFAAVNKLIFTTGMLEKKVKESTFFLNQEIKHVHLKPFDR